MAARQLDQLNAEIAVLCAKADAVEKKWLAATDPQERAALRELYTDTRFERRQVDARRAALEAALLETGGQTPLLHFYQCQAPWSGLTPAILCHATGCAVHMWHSDRQFVIPASSTLESIASLVCSSQLIGIEHGKERCLFDSLCLVQAGSVMKCGTRAAIVMS